MKLSKSLLGAVLVGITVQTTGCTKDDAPTPAGEQSGKSVKQPYWQKAKGGTTTPDNCPACGMG